MNLFRCLLLVACLFAPNAKGAVPGIEDYLVHPSAVSKLLHTNIHVNSVEDYWRVRMGIDGRGIALALVRALGHLRQCEIPMQTSISVEDENSKKLYNGMIEELKGQIQALEAEKAEKHDAEKRNQIDKDIKAKRDDIEDIESELAPITDQSKAFLDQFHKDIEEAEAKLQHSLANINMLFLCGSNENALGPLVAAMILAQKGVKIEIFVTGKETNGGNSKYSPQEIVSEILDMFQKNLFPNIEIINPENISKPIENTSLKGSIEMFMLAFSQRRQKRTDENWAKYFGCVSTEALEGGPGRPMTKQENGVEAIYQNPLKKIKEGFYSAVFECIGESEDCTGNYKLQYVPALELANAAQTSKDDKNILITNNGSAVTHYSALALCPPYPFLLSFKKEFLPAVNISIGPIKSTLCQNEYYIRQSLQIILTPEPVQQILEDPDQRKVYENDSEVLFFKYGMTGNLDAVPKGVNPDLLTSVTSPFFRYIVACNSQNIEYTTDDSGDHIDIEKLKQLVSSYAKNVTVANVCNEKVTGFQSIPA